MQAFSLHIFLTPNFVINFGLIQLSTFDSK